MVKKTKQKKKPQVKQKSKTKLIVFSVVAGILLIVFVLIPQASHYIAQQNDLKELEAAGKDLRIVYEKILKVYGQQLTYSTFDNICTEAGSKSRGTITCGPRGLITTNSTPEDIQNIENRSELYKTVLSGMNTFQNITKGSINEDRSNLRIAFTHNNLSCAISEVHRGKSISTEAYCIKTVPDFLPGYKVEK